jgi:hypothetical protein
MVEDLIGKAMDVVTGGKYSKRKVEKKEEALKVVDEVTRKIDFNVSKRVGKDILIARTSELSEDLKSELEKIGSKAREDGKFAEGSLTWGDFYNVALAVSDLQGRQPPLFLKDKDEFARQASGEEAANASTPIIIGDSDIPLKYLIGRLKVGVYKDKHNGGNGQTLEFTITPDSPELKVHGEVADAVYSKIKNSGVPLRDTTWQHEIYKKRRES